MASSFSHSPQKTAVLVITTHGDFEAEVDTSTGGLHPKTVETLGMDIVVLQAATCGVVNLVQPSDVVSYITTIRRAVSGFNGKTPKKKMIKLIQDIRTKIMMIDNQPDIVAKEVSLQNPNFVNNSRTMDYFHHSNKSYTVSSDGILFDKRFSRENDQTTRGSRDWKVNLLGDRKSKDEDLMVTLNPNVTSLRNAGTRDESSVARMSDILQHLNERGVKKVLIFDFTCSVAEYDLTERELRDLRRNDNKPRGGNHKTKRKTTRKSRCIGKCNTRRH